MAGLEKNRDLLGEKIAVALELEEQFMGKPSILDVQTEAVRSSLLEIAKRNGGNLRVDDVLEVAQESTHILHQYFEWDDSAAAEEYRRAQAGCLIRRVKFAVMREVKETKTVDFTAVRQFQSRPSQRNPEGGYEDVVDIMQADSKRQEMLDAAMSELAAFERRYAELTELATVLTAIKRIITTKKSASA